MRQPAQSPSPSPSPAAPLRRRSANVRLDGRAMEPCFFGMMVDV